MVTVGRRSRGLMVSRSDLLILLSRTNENEAKLRECPVVSQAATPGGITPALTEASISVEVVKPEEDTMVAERTSDDWPTLQLRTLRFNALLYS